MGGEAGVDNVLVVGRVLGAAPAEVELGVVKVDRGPPLRLEVEVAEPAEVAAAFPKGRPDGRHRDDEVGAEVGAQPVDKPHDAGQGHALLDVEVDALQVVLAQELV